MSSIELDCVYFAWIRERIGSDRERITIPDNVRTPDELMAYLATRSAGHAAAFENRQSVRVAVDKKVADGALPFGAPSEIAFFPPMTGG